MKRKNTALISRRNWMETRQYLNYVEEVRQAKPGTVSVYRGALDLLLHWSRDCQLPRLSQLRPVFPVWLSEGQRSASYQDKVCQVIRGFLVWSKTRFSRYEPLSAEFVETIRPAAGDGEVRDREIWTIEDVRSLLTWEPQTLAEERDLAAAAMLFLSGMRVGAFATLPIRSVDLSRWMVMQWPSYGVHTKYSKAANTWLLNAEDLREVVSAWDAKVRAALPETAMWYALIEPAGQAFAKEQAPGKHRSSGFNKRLRDLCAQTGVPYRSAHKFRHGHAVYLLKRVQTLDEYKAVSQNLMHESMMTTDSIYSTMLADDVEGVITRLADVPARADDSVLDLVRELMQRLEAGKAV